MCYEYYKKMEVEKIKSNAVEDNEATMDIFLCGLNREISDIMELYHYVKVDDLVH